MGITNQALSTAPAQSLTNSNDEVTHRNPMVKDIPFYPDPTYRPPPKPVRTPMPGSSQSSDSTNIDPEINIDFEENSPFQEGIISEIYQKPEKTFFQEPGELADLINTSNLIQRFLPRQTDIDKILKVIQRKVLTGLHLPVTIKEIQAGYLISPYFRDMYLYLAQHKLPSTKPQFKRWKHWQKIYTLLDSLLFKIVTIWKRKQHYRPFQKFVQIKSSH